MKKGRGDSADKGVQSALRETALYEPIRAYLQAAGFIVQAEVRHCDIVATQEEQMVIVELKRSMSIALIAQAVERQRITDWVYVAIPRPKGSLRNAQWKGTIHLLRRLGLGLIFVSLTTRKPIVDVVLDPDTYQPRPAKKERQLLLKEMHGRSGDYNVGGSTRRKLMTAYRENAVHIACCLERHESLSPRELRALGTGTKTLTILSKNYYGWFERVGRGRYALSERGRAELNQFSEIAEHYRGDFPSTLPSN